MTETLRMREIQQDFWAAGRQVWLAGLGAVASLEDGGSRFLDRVKTWSEEMEERRRDAAIKLEESGQRMASEVDDKARQAEMKVESWAADFLHRFDVPTRRDFDALHERIEELVTMVEAWRAGNMATNKTVAARAVTEASTPARALTESDRRKVLHVEPHDKGWQIKVVGTPRYERVEATKKAAVTAARGLAKRHVPSTLVIHRQDGSVQTRSSYDENAST